uniref:Uncharacterized protein At5g48480 n=1 Tax=Anthurium amnicola TaxID=1678845 RepID=A0A1D1XS31_9ARAE
MAQECGVEAVPAVNGAAKAGAVGFASFKPQLVVPGYKADEAVQFYKEAFGAEELRRVSHLKRKAEKDIPLILCAELKIGSSSLLVCDQTDDAAGGKAVGGSVVFRLEAADVEAAISKAVKAGAVLEGEVSEEGEGPCGGGLVGTLRDPFGQAWIVASVGTNCVSDA